jgi:hypothetical protein
LDPTREQLALAVPAIRASQSLGAGQLGALAALAHRLCPGARLM